MCVYIVFTHYKSLEFLVNYVTYIQIPLNVKNIQQPSMITFLCNLYNELLQIISCLKKYKSDMNPHIKQVFTI